MTENLNGIAYCPDVLHGSRLCHIDCHKLALENYYNNIVLAAMDAESILPRTNPAFQHSYWSHDLDTLKQESIECTENWKRLGSPSTGPIFDCKRSCSLKYKSEICLF